MFKELKNILVYASVFLILAFVIFVINQTAQVVSLASTVHPALGITTLIFLVLTYVALIAVPVFTYYRLPSALIPPEDENSEEYAAYMVQLKKRLSKNPYIRQHNLRVETDSDVEEAFSILNDRADEMIREVASSIFVTTAVSQNGRLDALMVIIAQTKLVWSLSHLYNQRPTLRYMSKLYGNIAATTFIVSELEELNIAAHIEPVMASIFGASVMKSVPGAAAAATIVTNSLLEGTANAFLTLRVGAITKKYCTATTVQNKWSIRSSASLEAAKNLGTIAVKCANMVTKSVIEATKNLGLNTVKNSGNMIFDASRKTFDMFKNISDKVIGSEAEDDFSKTGTLTPV